MFSLLSIGKRFKGRISFTMLLVFLETGLSVLFPLFIGWAVNDLVKGEYTGVILLAGLGVSSLVIGAARRFYDTRIYSAIYSEVATDMIDHAQQTKLSISKQNGRSGLLTELVEFFEHSMPGIILCVFGVLGTLGIVATLNIYVFLGCLLLLLLMVMVYWLTGKTQYRYHEGYNHEYEQRVDVLSAGKINDIAKHFKDLMRWNIKLSDMETINFSVVWLGVICLFVATPIFAVQTAAGVPEVGTVLALLMYVFDYSEKVATLPFFIQQLIRLSEISNRLNSVESEAESSDGDQPIESASSANKSTEKE